MSKTVVSSPMTKVLANHRYRGQHVVVVAGKVFTAKNGPAVERIIRRMEKLYPKETLAITYVPKADALVLWV